MGTTASKNSRSQFEMNDFSTVGAKTSETNSRDRNVSKQQICDCVLDFLNSGKTGFSSWKLAEYKRYVRGYRANPNLNHIEPLLKQLYIKAKAKAEAKEARRGDDGFISNRERSYGITNIEQAMSDRMNSALKEISKIKI